MKLRNKRTGEIAEPFGITCMNGRTFVQFDDGKGTFKFEAHSLAELNTEWEDYEEPKEYWYIDISCTVKPTEGYFSSNAIEILKEAGNCFESKEEAEKAVEKLKAWKRLKDKGFRFIGIAGLKSEIYFCADEKYDNAHIMFDEYGSSSDDLKQYNKDLDLLFGGEE